MTGYAVAVFRIGDLVEAALGPAGTKGIAVTITDVLDNAVIYRSSAAAAVGGSRFQIRGPAVGDAYPTTRVLGADGVVSLIGCVMGNPFINAVYIGRPGWKAMGGRTGYSAATGLFVIILCWLGLISVMLALIPTIAILPILLYIGMLIGSQAFQETPKSHAPAIILGLTPHMAHMAHWGGHDDQWWPRCGGDDHPGNDARSQSGSRRRDEKRRRPL